MNEVLGVIGKIIGKFIIFLGICGIIYAIICIFSDSWKDGILPMVYSISGVFFGGTISHFSKKQSPPQEDENTSNELGEFAGEIISEIAAESISVAGGIAAGSVSAVVDTVSNIDIPS